MYMAFLTRALVDLKLLQIRKKEHHKQAIYTLPMAMTQSKVIYSSIYLKFSISYFIVELCSLKFKSK
ncbi:hypothetical protein Scep_010139 [Stephania cephalantha]|uniref:Uncharacterized protein n=1 Tax=Stephania cephalantha TaxID=152367 RepID=A0AAP0JUG4_9MAGN